MIRLLLVDHDIICLIAKKNMSEFLSLFSRIITIAISISLIVMKMADPIFSVVESIL